ncbi:MAG: hypothetical protein FWD40_10495 [Treponema sp.]|nr:hypothetical protein [Treponema sp.]
MIEKHYTKIIRRSECMLCLTMPCIPGDALHAGNKCRALCGQKEGAVL